MNSGDDPYGSPGAPLAVETEKTGRSTSRGGALPFSSCPECGSEDLASDSVLRGRPSIVGVMLFGWNYLLVRAALVRKTVVCRNCGATRRYRSLGALLALLVFLALLLVLLAFASN